MALHQQPPTVLTLKQTFLTTQTRLLSQPLQPSRAWRRAHESSSPTDAEDGNNNNNNNRRIPEKALDDALLRLNHTLQQHARRVYVPQATRLVAEQIDTLYYLDAAAATTTDNDDDNDSDAWRNVGTDYTNTNTISSLPQTWDSSSARGEQAAQRYAELAAQLRDRAARRDELAARVAHLRRIRALLAPFDDAVQGNLVTRDGEVERELERMRVLLARVGDRVARLKGRGDGDEDEDELFGDGNAMVVDDVEVQERRKVDGLLSGMG